MSTHVPSDLLLRSSMISPNERSELSIPGPITPADIGQLALYLAIGNRAADKPGTFRFRNNLADAKQPDELAKWIDYTRYERGRSFEASKKRHGVTLEGYAGLFRGAINLIDAASRSTPSGPSNGFCGNFFTTDKAIHLNPELGSYLDACEPSFPHVNGLRLLVGDRLKLGNRDPRWAPRLRTFTAMATSAIATMGPVMYALPANLPMSAGLVLASGIGVGLTMREVNAKRRESWAESMQKKLRMIDPDSPEATSLEICSYTPNRLMRVPEGENPDRISWLLQKIIKDNARDPDPRIETEIGVALSDMQALENRVAYLRKLSDNDLVGIPVRERRDALRGAADKRIAQLQKDLDAIRENRQIGPLNIRENTEQTALEIRIIALVDKLASTNNDNERFRGEIEVLAEILHGTARRIHIVEGSTMLVRKQLEELVGLRNEFIGALGAVDKDILSRLEVLTNTYRALITMAPRHFTLSLDDFLQMFPLASSNEITGIFPIYPGLADDAMPNSDDLR